MQLNTSILRRLLAKKRLMMVWALWAGFGTYFCMYAFRKPFNAAQYQGLFALGISFKSAAVICQVLGYLVSKIIGIKVIAELASGSRHKLALVLISVSVLGLGLFWLLPTHLKFAGLFISSLPLGMVWGVVFSYLEGRRFTEFFASGLVAAPIVASGMFKQLGRVLIEEFHVSDFKMPFLIGLCFFPLFIFHIWMLQMIPAPSSEDVAQKVKRVPLPSHERNDLLRRFGIPLALLIGMYLLVGTLRDLRDNFAIELWKESGEAYSNAVLSQTEWIVATLCVIALVSISFIRHNFKAMMASQAMIVSGSITMILCCLLYRQNLISTFTWSTCLGIGIYLVFIPFQCMVFERFIANFKIAGNAGFFMYLADSSAYMGSVALLLVKELNLFNDEKVSWISFTLQAGIWVGIATIALSVLFVFKAWKMNSRVCSNGPVQAQPYVSMSL